MIFRDSIRLLLPSSALPDEAAEWPDAGARLDAPTEALSRLFQLASAVPLQRGDSQQTTAGMHMVAADLFIKPGQQPQLSVLSEEFTLNLSSTIDAIDGFGVEPDGSTWTPEQIASVLREAIASASGYRSADITVLLANPSAAAGKVPALLGAMLLNDEVSLDHWRRFPGVSVLTDEEVEGRGLRAAAAAVGLMLSLARTAGGGSAPLRDVGAAASAAASAPLTSSPESFGDTASEERTTIAVSSQVLQQEAPTMNERVLRNAAGSAIRIVVDIDAQRAFLLVGDRIAIETPISSARAGKETPRGTFRITEKVERNKVSTIYGVALPYWMRLDGSAIGLHVGALPGLPASAGCIRLPEEVAQLFFKYAKSGTTVQILNRLAQ